MALLKLKLLAKESLIYGVSGIIAKFIAVFLVPVYTRVFSPADYGMINIINTTFLLVGMFAVFALDNAVARWFYDTEDQEQKRSTFASWFWFQLVTSVVLALLLLFTAPVFYQYVLFIPLTKDTIVIWLLPCASLISNILPSIIWNWFRLNKRPISTVVFTISQSLLTVGLTIVFVAVLKIGVKGVYLALFLSGLVFSLAALVQMKEWLHLKYFNKTLLWDMLKFSLPMIPASIASWLLSAAGTYFVLYYAGKTEVGLYSIGASVASIVALITGSFQQAWGPFAFSIIHEKDAKQTYANVFLVYGTLCSIIILGMFLFAPEILMIFTTKEYQDSAWVASILSINMVLISISSIGMIGSAIEKKTIPYSVGIIIGAICTVFLNILFIPLWGKEGAGISIVFSQLIALSYIFYCSQRLYPIGYKFNEVVFIAVLAALLGWIGRVYFIDTSFLLGILNKTGVIVIFVCIVYVILRKEIGIFFSRFLKGS